MEYILDSWYQQHIILTVCSTAYYLPKYVTSILFAVWLLWDSSCHHYIICTVWVYATAYHYHLWHIFLQTESLFSSILSLAVCVNSITPGHFSQQHIIWTVSFKTILFNKLFGSILTATVLTAYHYHLCSLHQHHIIWLSAKQHIIYDNICQPHSTLTNFTTVNYLWQSA
jgi:hypothetical protein